MTYQEFIEQIKLKAQNELSYSPDMIEFYPEGFTSEDPKILEQIIQCNQKFENKDSPWLLEDFLLLKIPVADGTELVARFATQSLYKRAEKNGFDSVFELVRKTDQELRTAKVNYPAFSKRIETKSYDEIRDQLILRPLNYGLHMNQLKGCVYKRIGDICLVLYQFIGDVDKVLTTSKIMREELSKWGMENQEEKVLQDALENSMKLFPPCVYDYKKQSEVNFLTESFSREDITIRAKIMLSTFKTTNGALALFYPGVIEKMISIMNGSFIAVFMNINDVMIFELNDRTAERYSRIAKDPSQSSEVLSSRMYLCDKTGIKPL